MTEATELRRYLRSQMEFGNEGMCQRLVGGARNYSPFGLLAIMKELLMEIVSPEILEQSVQLLGDPNLTQEQAADELITQGTDDLIASRLVAFIPEAFGIALISHMKVKTGFPSSFIVRDKMGKVESVLFSSEPVFVMALNRAQSMYHEGPRSVFVAISSRSSILKLINDALNRGATFDGSKIAIAFGIPAEIYTKQKTSVWRRIFGS